MPIPFTCPHCGMESDVAEEYAGQSGPCAKCGRTITVPPAGAVAGGAAAKSSSGILVPAVVAVCVVGAVVVCGGILVRLLLPAVQSARQSARQTQCSNNLQQIATAVFQYRVRYDSFPPPFIADENGRPMHSWRVLILPFLGHQALYDRYDLDQPWDAPTNLALTSMIPQVYRCPRDTMGLYCETSYLMIVGPETISDGPTARKFAEIKDGTVCTIMVVEVANSGIDWMEPRDLKAEDITFAINDGTAEGIRSEHPGLANVLFCDGTVHTVPDTTDPARIRAMSTIAGGEEVDRSFEDF